MSTIEIIAAIPGLLAVWLQARERILAWPFAIINVSILAYIFFVQRLYSDFGLHVIYFFLNIYGWIVWSNKKDNQEVKPIRSMNTKEIGLAVGVTLLGSLVLGYIMKSNTDADVPYFDAFTTCGSLVAQYLLARKFFQNWAFWIIVDIVAIPLYIHKGLFIVAGLFTAFLIISIYGYFEWRAAMKEQEQAVLTVAD